MIIPFISEHACPWMKLASNPSSAAKLIEQARAGGRKVEVIYVHRRFPLALDNIVSRYLVEKHRSGSGRILPADVAIAAHLGAQRTIIGPKGVPFLVIDNNGAIVDAYSIPLENS